MRLALLQHACPVGSSRDDAFDRFEQLLGQACDQGDIDVVATQELFLSPYFPQTEDESHFDLAEPVPGPTTDRLAGLARRCRVVLAASLFEKRAPGLHHNTTVTFSPSGEILHRYRKAHIPHDPRFFEKYYFAPGDTTPAAVPTPAGPIGNLVCWDQWFPEAARLAALAGARVLLYPTAIGHHNDPDHGDADLAPTQFDAWRTVMRAHAIANGVYVAAVNRVGVEDELTFWGGSFVCGPDGRVLAEASRDAEQALVVDLDLAAVETQRRGWPFFRDRRVDLYAGLLQRWGADSALPAENPAG